MTYTELLVFIKVKALLPTSEYYRLDYILQPVNVNDLLPSEDTVPEV